MTTTHEASATLPAPPAVPPVVPRSPDRGTGLTAGLPKLMITVVGKWHGLETMPQRRETTPQFS